MANLKEMILKIGPTAAALSEASVFGTIFGLRATLSSIPFFADLILLPAAVLLFSILAAFTVYEAYKNDHDKGLLFKAGLYTLSAIALAFAVTMLFLYASVFLTISLLIFTVHFLIHAIYDIFNFFKACYKGDSDAAIKQLFLAVGHILAAATVFIVFVLGQVIWAKLGILSSVIIISGIIFGTCALYCNDQPDEILAGPLIKDNMTSDDDKKFSIPPPKPNLNAIQTNEPSSPPASPKKHQHVSLSEPGSSKESFLDSDDSPPPTLNPPPLDSQIMTTTQIAQKLEITPDTLPLEEKKQDDSPTSLKTNTSSDSDDSDTEKNEKKKEITTSAAVSNTQQITSEDESLTILNKK